MGRALDDTLAVLNGAIGDYLVRSDNGLATEMALFEQGEPLVLERELLGVRFPSARRRVVVLVHGLMCTESIWRHREGWDYGSLLARDLDYSPLYLRYNTGLAIADNGAALARLLERLLASWPVEIEELLLLGYSMGGLVVRSACHVAGNDQAWLRKVRRSVYVGTPHRGAPLERAGRILARLMQRVDDPYTRLAADLANLRSEGVKDLGDADLRHEDRLRSSKRLSLRDARHPVPLLPTIDHLLIAGTIAHDPWLAALFGDALVPVSSATDGGETEGPSVEVFPGLDHLELARRPEVYLRMRSWLKERCG